MARLIFTVQFIGEVGIDQGFLIKSLFINNAKLIKVDSQESG